jgi:signal transduction histidine kinase
MAPYSPFFGSLPWLLTIGSALVAAALCWRLHVTVRAYRACLDICARAHEGEANVTRILRLFARELQGLSLTLRGHADQLVAEGHVNAPYVGGAAAQLGGLADELEHHLMPTGERRALACAVVSLSGLVADSIASLAAAMSPGRRNWRVPRGLATDVQVFVDPRAMRQVLTRVLGEAVRNSGHNDWIEINWATGADGITLLVEDEGAWPPGEDAVTSTDTPPRQISRGIGLRLSLARTLVQAHGGTLDVELIERIGTRVTVHLPPHRLRGGRQDVDTSQRQHSLSAM